MAWVGLTVIGVLLLLASIMDLVHDQADSLPGDHAAHVQGGAHVIRYCTVRAARTSVSRSAQPVSVLSSTLRSYGEWWLMEWFWWVLILFWTGGFAWVADTVRTALRNRHERKLELIDAAKQERLAVEAAHQAPEPVCGCAHHLAKHDKQGRCHERVEVPTAWDENKKPLRYEAGECNCQQYVGPQPLSQVYAEDLTDRT